METYFIMSIAELNQSKTPIIKIDKNLEKYSRKVLFPKKLAMANKLLEKAIYQFFYKKNRRSKLFKVPNGGFGYFAYHVVRKKYK